MSHVTNIDITIKDLAALKGAVAELGAQWREGQQRYQWYGHHVGDYPLPAGMTEADLGKCSHAIRLPGCEYEIGVVQKGNGYTLAFDFWGPGQKLKTHFGDGLARLKQIYGVHKATAAARAKGYMVQRKPQPNGAIKLVVTGI
ncbi:MAG: hypothetical protein QOE70_891 [Chthoniobacter sp.]|jgi:hypothetical protein|nr:hypothetical protein [Chthoniobacter sp.]